MTSARSSRRSPRGSPRKRAISRRAMPAAVRSRGRVRERSTAIALPFGKRRPCRLARFDLAVEHYPWTGLNDPESGRGVRDATNVLDDAGGLAKTSPPRCVSRLSGVASPWLRGACLRRLSGGAPLSRRRSARVAFVTFLRRHLAHDESPSSDLVIH